MTPTPRTAVGPVWTVSAAGKKFRMRTCSARTALANAEKVTKHPATLVGLTFEERERPTRSTGPARHVRRRTMLLPEALRRQKAGETITDIARALRLPRETVRDWLLSVAA